MLSTDEIKKAVAELKQSPEEPAEFYINEPKLHPHPHFSIQEMSTDLLKIRCLECGDVLTFFAPASQN